MASELPTGTVTFPGFDGSTRLLQRQLGDSWGDVLAEHHRLLRGAFTEGVAARSTRRATRFVAFRAPGTPRLPQRKPSGPRGTTGPTRSSSSWMGLHTGEPSVGDEGYLGIDVRAARICLGCTRCAGAGVGDHALVGGDDFLDLGHRLKDIDGEQRLFQLVGDGLRAEFPPVRTVDLRPDVPAPPLPLDLSGREEVHAQRAHELTVQIHSQVSEKLARDLADIPGVDLSSLGIPGPPPPPASHTPPSSARPVQASEVDGRGG